MPSGSGNGSGSSWANASGNIAAMISASASGDQVWIKKGTYTPAATLSMKNGVAIYGGFAGSETLLSQRNFIINQTIISGGGSIQVFNNSGLNNTAILDGLAISNGSSGDGAGMNNSGSSPIIRNCIFSGNNAQNGVGGGMNNTNSSNPTITNCVFTGNAAYFFGGGIFNQYSSFPSITNCVFTGNGSGAVYSYSSAGCTLVNCSIIGNSGGGVYYGGNGSSVVSNSIVYGNSGGNVTGAPSNITFSDIGGGYFGTGNINTNPVFYNEAAPAGADAVWMTADDGLQPFIISQCIESGTTGAGMPTTDILGIARSATAPTMGAYEKGLCIPNHKIYLNPANTSSGIGSSWATATASIDAAFRTAMSCSNIDTIWIAAGNNIPKATLRMKNGLAIIGGFAGNETLLSQRNFAANPTIISGGNVRQVFNNANLNSTAVLDGCTISNGNATGNGAGMYNSYASPAIRNCIFKDNVCNSTVNEGGGGMYNYYSNPAIANCVFANNIVNNGLSGGGMSNENSNPAISNCVFTGNIVNNSGLGGGMLNFTSNPIINNSVFMGNSANDGDGGGIYNWFSVPVITNSIVYGNSALSNPNVSNNSATPTITYSDIEGGFAGTGNISQDPFFVNASTPAGADSKWMTADDGLALMAWSPAINAGTTTTPALPNDIIGNLRIGAYDMGAYEFQPGNFCTNTAIVYVDSTNGSDANNGSTWALAFKTLTTALAYSQLCNNTDSILVAKGTYYPTGVQNNTDRDRTFLINRGNIKIYGGYPSGGGIRNVTTYPTILNGNIGNANSVSDNSYHVMAIAGLALASDSVVVDGLTITGGNATGSSGFALLNGVNVDKNSGGGVVAIGNNNTSKVLFRNCNFLQNSAAAGGGLSNTTTSPTFINCTFNNNSSGDGGGMANYNLSTPLTILNCSFSNNASTRGGGILNNSSSLNINNCSFNNNTGSSMYNIASSPIISNTSFTNNGGTSAGGGMYNLGGSPTLNNCVFSGNTTSQTGGGMYNKYSSPNINNCSFSNNSADKGGGLYNDDASSPMITKCSFTGNTATTEGGGIYSYNSTLNILNSSFSNNTANKGGGMYNNYAAPAISNCLFNTNTTSEGGGIFNNYGSLTLSNTTFRNNTATNGGGAIKNSNSSLNSNNCVFYGNSSNMEGGAILNLYTTISISNATFSNNTALGNGGSIFLVSAPSALITNSIFYGNSSGIYLYAGSLTVRYSNIQGGFTGIGNINANPLFADAANGDFHLSCGSPSVNAGNNTDIPPGVTIDLDSATRIQSGAVDMGAYEGNWPGSNNLSTSSFSSYKELQTGRVSYGNCGGLITTLSSTGNSPLADSVKASVWIEATQPAQFVKRHFEITPKSNASTATGTVTLYFLQSEFDAFNAVNTSKLPTGPNDATGKGNLLVEKRSGTSSNGTGLPDTYTGSIATINPVDSSIVWNAASNRWEVTFDVTGFSGFFVKTAASVLPLNWLSVTGNMNAQKQAVINWKVQENNVVNYEVEKSTDGISFVSIGAVNSKGDGINSYSFTDVNAMTGTTFYRIKQTDRDGEYSYSIIIRLSAGGMKSNLSIYPNPVHDNVSVTGATVGNVLKLMDLNGKLLQTIKVTQPTFSLDVSRYSSGIYLLQSNDGTTVKMIKQ
ncbi:MAG: choice-of-anchor Q domain-containing protein [Ferruginibacter sp.]